jgi:hypothetical protein
MPVHLSAAAGHAGIHVGHIMAVAQGRVRVVNGVRVLGGGDALTGQGGLFDLEGGRLDQTPIGRHAVTRLQQHDVARYHLAGIDLADIAVATRAGGLLHRGLQRFQTSCGLGFTVQRNHCVEHCQEQQHDRRGPITGDHDVDHGRADQDDLHEVLILAQEGMQPRLLLLFG